MLRLYRALLFMPRGKPKCGAFALFAVNTDISTHQLRQLLANTEPEASTAVFARGGTINLGKWFKNRRHDRFGNPDSTVTHRKTERKRLLRCNFTADDNLTALGKFDGIAHQIGNHLSYSAGVTLQLQRNGRIYSE